VLGATGVAPSFRIVASAERPIVNPCFVVRNWNTAAPAKLDLNSEVRASGPKFRQGIVPRPERKAVVGRLVAARSHGADYLHLARSQAGNFRQHPDQDRTQRQP